MSDFSDPGTIIKEAIKVLKENTDISLQSRKGLLGLGEIGRRAKDIVLAPLYVLSFWKMKDRARRIGETGAHLLLLHLQQAAPAARFHCMGHSFGCIVVSAMIAGAQNVEWPV